MNLAVDIIVQDISHKLPTLARTVIKNSYNTTQDKYRVFYENPDDPEEHTPRYHQWGIITHIRKFEEYYREEVPTLLKNWGILDEVETELGEAIDAVPKSELLRIAILFHDLGKFATRSTRRRKDGSLVNNFIRHEVASGKIIRSARVDTVLTEYGLTPQQKEYIARCAELHFTLGEVRNSLKMSPQGYTLEFVVSTGARKIYGSIAGEYRNFCIELGILFLADSLAKTEIRGESLSDAELRRLIREKGANPKLMNAVKQQPVNVTLAKEYLFVCLQVRD